MDSLIWLYVSYNLGCCEVHVICAAAFLKLITLINFFSLLSWGIAGHRY